MDRALWITWYDLPEAGRAEHLSWLHETYLPELLARPGFRWGAHYATVPKTSGRGVTRSAVQTEGKPAVPVGEQYILLFGAEDLHVFGDPTPSVLHAHLSTADREMLAMRSGERVNIMTEATRVEGPDAKHYPPGSLLAPFIQLGTYNYAWQEEEDMLAWYTHWRLPAMARMPGIIRTRKLASVAGWAKHGILYEWISAEAKEKHYPGHEDNYPEMKAWSDRIVPKLQHAPGTTNVARKIWPL